jgi:hypothetical protein
MEVKYFEVEISFLSPAGAVVPVTARSEDEAKEIALHLFRDYQDIKVNSVKDITTDTNQPVPPMMLN